MLMNTKIWIPLFLLTLSIIPLSATLVGAQELAPGDTCSAGEINFIASTGGPETSGTSYVLRCDGASWEQYGKLNETGTFLGDGSDGVGGVAIGDLSFSSSSTAVAIGLEAFAGAGSAIAIGTYMEASASGAVAIGNNGGASGNNSVAIGDDASAGGTSSYALGDDTAASGDYSYAFGKYSWAQAPRSYAFGYLTRIDPASNDTIAFNIGGTGGLTGVNSPNSFIINGGNVGINDVTPSVALDVVGDIHYTGVIQDMSDRRLKDNIEVLADSLDGILNLKGYSYTMKSDDAAKTEYGLMAQEVETVFPHLVSTQDDGFKTLNYIGLIAPLVEATKAQQTLIDAQKAEIDEQQAALDAQQVQIDDLLSRLQAIEQQQ